MTWSLWQLKFTPWGSFWLHGNWFFFTCLWKFAVEIFGIYWPLLWNILLVINISLTRLIQAQILKHHKQKNKFLIRKKRCIYIIIILLVLKLEHSIKLHNLQIQQHIPDCGRQGRKNLDLKFKLGSISLWFLCDWRSFSPNHHSLQLLLRKPTSSVWN